MLKKGRKTALVAVILVVLLFTTFAGVGSGELFKAQALESTEKQALEAEAPVLEKPESLGAEQTVQNEKTAVYTVVFNTDGGSNIANIINVPAGTKIPKPKDPVKNGYDFKGWYTSRDFSKNVIWMFGMDEIWEDTVLYAYWVECSSTVVPPDPGEPSTPTEPSEPSTPTDPSEPSTPTDPSEPSTPTDPSEPSTPTEPSEPSTPTDPSEPSTPTDPSEPSTPTDPSEPSTPTDPSEPSTPTTPPGGGSTGGGGGGNHGGGTPPSSSEKPPVIIEELPPPLADKPNLPQGGSNRIGILVVVIGAAALA